VAETPNDEEKLSVAQNGSSVEKHAERATRNASPWIERLARAGYVAYGVVYVLVGVLAVQAAFVGGGKAASQEGELRQVLLAPPGRVLLGLVAIGLLAYSAWRLFQGCWTQRTRAGARKGS
jgi:ferric-dicitrate binding protein FerR (iron transport regulator)